MGARGPEPVQLNREEFLKLVSMQCTQEEIASWFNISVDTLDRWCLREMGEKLAEFWDKRKFTGKVRVRKAQFAIMEAGGSGAATMAIFLGKALLGQRDTPPDTPPNPSITGMIGTQPLEKFTFAQFCQNAKYPAPYPKQLEIQAFIVTGSDPRMLLGSRGYGKTEYGTILGLAYDIYLNPDENTTLIITKSRTRNAAIMYEIAAALKANGVELDAESTTHIRLKGLVGPNHTVEAITIKASLRGRHPKRIIMDDPVTDEDTSEAMRKLVKKRYDEAYKLCKNIVIIGQPAHAFDLFAELRGLVNLMEVPHGTIPELDADLAAMEAAGVDKNSIEMSYHLRIPKSGSTIFSNIKYVDAYPTGDSVAFIDPSDGGDYTALAIARGYMDGIAATGACWKKPWYHALDDIVAMLVARKVKRVCFETNNTGNQPIEQLRKLLAPYGIGVVGKHSDSNKHACIQSAGSYAHMIHLSKDTPKVYTDLVVKYEYGAEFDDPPDSLARLLEWAGLIRGKK